MTKTIITQEQINEKLFGNEIDYDGKCNNMFVFMEERLAKREEPDSWYEVAEDGRDMMNAAMDIYSSFPIESGSLVDNAISAIAASAYRAAYNEISKSFSFIGDSKYIEFAIESLQNENKSMILSIKELTDCALNYQNEDKR